MLEPQTKAPVFSAQDQTGTTRSLEEFQGKYVVLYFYPKDDTSGCTTEACGLRDNYETLAKMATIVGISADSVGSHKQFAEKYHLPFMLLADPKKEIIKAYKAVGIPMTKRITYVINPEGIIVKTYPKVDPSKHASEIIADLQNLQQSS